MGMMPGAACDGDLADGGGAINAALQRSRDDCATNPTSLERNADIEVAMENSIACGEVTVAERP